ncbi:MAG TPA: prephenate dehydrogenase/arogenate dehydrogenase family protein [Candidatus Parcubacteria bacterium]|nr:prephenate dehydrogenase/arogenate dehydrogenase family protein [Candidatus Parcubacteria bacterium]
MEKEKNINKLPIIGIIGGKGKMGNWFKMFFEKEGLKVLVSDKKTKLSSVQLVKESDIIIVSVPIKETIGVIKKIRRFVSRDALLTDLTSLKSEPVREMRKADCGVLGMHPLFGPLVQEIKSQKIVFCDARHNKWVDFLRNIFERNGGEIIEISPEDHDKQMAVIQALTHFSNISLARTIFSRKINLLDSLLTPVFRLQSLIIGRVLSQNPKLYADIEIENPYFQSVLKVFQKEVKETAVSVRNKNYKDFIRKFNQASFYLKGFKEVAQTKSSQVLRFLERQPVRLGERERPVSIKNPGLKIGFLGPKGTFTHQAVLETFGVNGLKMLALPTIENVFEKVNNREIDFGVVPAENTNGGLVAETINSLIRHPLKVSGSFEVRIHHCLLARTKNKNDLKVIKTHPQAFAQCRDWLQINLPGAELKNSSSTTAPILESRLDADISVGFIGSKIAANVYSLNVLAENIEDNKENITKFFVISRDINEELKKELKAEKTLLLFAVYDRVGVLRDILNVFARNNINLTSLHSIPSHLKPWDYFFFEEIDTSYPSPLLEKVIKEINKYCPIIRIIGVSS